MERVCTRTQQAGYDKELPDRLRSGRRQLTLACPENHPDRGRRVFRRHLILGRYLLEERTYRIEGELPEVAQVGHEPLEDPERGRLFTAGAIGQPAGNRRGKGKATVGQRGANRQVGAEEGRE